MNRKEYFFYINSIYLKKKYVCAVVYVFLFVNTDALCLWMEVAARYFFFIFFSITWYATWFHLYLLKKEGTDNSTYLCHTEVLPSSSHRCMSRVSDKCHAYTPGTANTHRTVDLASRTYTYNTV